MKSSIQARSASSSGHGGGEFFNFAAVDDFDKAVYRKDSATGDILRLSFYSETVSVLLDGDADVNCGAIFMGRVITAGGQRCVYL